MGSARGMAGCGHLEVPRWSMMREPNIDTAYLLLQDGMGWDGELSGRSLSCCFHLMRPWVTIDVHYGAKKCNAGR